MFMSENKVYVTFRQHTDYQDIWVDNIAWVPKQILNNTKYVMEVQAEEFYAEVQTSIHPSVSKDVIASCLMAGLRHVPGYEEAFDDIAKQLRSGIGIEVFRGVSPRIAQVIDIEWSNGRPSYTIMIKDGVGHYAPACELVADHLVDTGEVQLSFKIKSSIQSIKIAARCPIDYFHEFGNQFVKEQQIRVIHELHQKFPDQGAQWEMLRVQWFGENEALTKQGADSWVGKKPNLAAVQNGNRDNRVDYLPGIKEKVTHPETGGRDTLERVIISLNDQHGWSRERVADWLETLDVDITFRSPSDE